MSSTRTASCIFCGRTSPFEFANGASRLDCPACGPYEVTVGAMAQLRSDARTKSGVRAAIRLQHDEGVERPRINADDVKALKDR
jgi:hypothetical protein